MEENEKMEIIYSRLREKILKLNPGAILSYDDTLKDWLISFTKDLHEKISFPGVETTFVRDDKGHFPMPQKIKAKNGVVRELILAYNNKRVCYLILFAD